MKYLILVVMFFLSILNVSAQKDLQLQQKNLDLMKKLLNQNFQFHKNLMDTAHKELLALNYEQKPIFLYEAGKGKVYAMPPDKMHCLKPTFHSTMPVDKKSPEIYIPNSLNGKKYFFIKDYTLAH